MKKMWDLSVRGKGHQVIVDASTSGEDVIRVDGRVAAQPLDPDETQRAFYIEGVAYSLLRNGKRDFELVAIGTGPAAMRQQQTETVRVESALARWWRAITRKTRRSAADQE